MIMKKQQWLFKQVFSMINSSSMASTTSSFNIVLRRQRPFCSATTTNTSLFAAAAPTDVAPPVQQKQLNMDMLLEKKLPLLIVPYDHVTKQQYVERPSRELVGGGFICDGTLGFISLFHDEYDDRQQHLIINNNKEKKKKKEVYKVYLPEIAKRRICGSSEGWLVTIHENGEFQLLNPVTKVILHLPPLTAFPGVHAECVSDGGEDSSTLCYITNLWGRPPYPRCGSHYFRENFILKVVTNTSTNSTTLPATVVVMAIYDPHINKGLAFCRTSSSSTGNGIDDDDDGIDHEPAAAKRWIKIPTADDDRDSWVDITFYKGNFYAVGHSGYVGVVKGLDGPSPFVQIIIGEPEDGPFSFYSMNYLVESSSSSSSSSSGGGDLLMVIRDSKNVGKYSSFSSSSDEEEETEEEEEIGEEEEKGKEEEIFEHPYRTIGFRVLKLDLNNGQPSWEEVTDLGKDCALFIGYNHSFSLSASKFPGCRGNCIYFTDSSICTYPTGGHDIGVYNLEDGSFDQKFYETSSAELFMPPPVWYVPN